MGDADDHETFEGTSSGASKTYPMQCSALRKNGHVLIKGKPCKIVDMSTSKTGKHGHAKVNLVGIDIFTGKKYEDICPSTHNMDVPNVNRQELELVDINEDGFCVLMSQDGETREDLALPTSDVGDDIRKRFEDGLTLNVTVLKAMDTECILSAKTATK